MKHSAVQLLDAADSHFCNGVRHFKAMQWLDADTHTVAGAAFLKMSFDNKQLYAAAQQVASALSNATEALIQPAPDVLTSLRKVFLLHRGTVVACSAYIERYSSEQRAAKRHREVFTDDEQTIAQLRQELAQVRSKVAHIADELDQAIDEHCDGMNDDVFDTLLTDLRCI